MSWIQDRDQQQALVKTVMNLHVPQNSGNISQVAKQLLASQGLSFIE